MTRVEPGTTGTSRYVAALTPWLEAAGHKVTLLGTRPSGTVGRALAPSRALGLDVNAFLASYPMWLRWPEADVYHLSVQTYASALLFRRPPGPAVVTVHDIIPYLLRKHQPSAYRHPVHRWFDWLAIRGLRRADALIADSEWTKRSVVEHPRVPPERISVAPLGVDHESFRPLDVPAAFRERYALPAEYRYILYVGSADRRKDLPTLWRAFARLHREFPEVRLLKVGAIQELPERSLLEEMAERLGIGTAVRFLDRVPEADLPMVYNAASVFVMPSLYEGFGLPVLEAMACGTPVVCAAAGALPEIAGRAAVQVPAGDPAALADKVRQLLRSQAARNRAREEGIRRAGAFSWSEAAARVCGVYQSTVVGGRAGG